MIGLSGEILLVSHSDVTSPFPPSGNGGYASNRDVHHLYVFCNHKNHIGLGRGGRYGKNRDITILFFRNITIHDFITILCHVGFTILQVV